MDKNFVKSLLVYGGSVGISRALPILMLPLYLTSLGSEVYGRVEVIFALFTFMLIFGLLQLETALQRMFFTAEDRISLFSSLLIVTTIFSVCVVVIVVAFSGSISFFLFNNEFERGSIIVSSIAVVFCNISTICMVYFRYVEKHTIFALLTLGQVIITTLVSYVFLVIMQFGSIGYFLGILSGWLFVAACSVYILNGDLKCSLNLDYIKQAFKFAIPQFPARLASFFIQFGNRFFILYILGAQAVTLMSLALKFSVFFQLFMLAFAMVWNPYLYRHENDESLNDKINSIFKALLFVLSLLHVATILLSETIVLRFFGDEYYEVANYVILAIIPTQLLIIKEVVESGIKLSNKTKYISHSYFLSAIITTVFMLVSNSIQGVLLSTIIGTLILVLITWYFSEKNNLIRYSKVSFLFYAFIITSSMYVI